jgi:hypothetical protein
LVYRLAPTHKGGLEMKKLTSLLAAIAVTALATSPVMAACPDTTSSTTNDSQKGIAKDGTRAPLENSANSETQKGAASTGTTTSSAKTAQKDGATMPMASDKNLATSQQDAEAQQKGEKTAQAKSKDCKS